MRGEPGDTNDVFEDGRDGPVLRVRVQLRASRRGVALADSLDVPISRIALISGAASRRKRFAVAGVAAPALREALAQRVGGRPPYPS